MASLAVRTTAKHSVYLCPKCRCVRRQAARSGQAWRVHTLCPGHWFPSHVVFNLKENSSSSIKANRFSRHGADISGVFPPNGPDSDFLQCTSGIHYFPCKIYPPCKPCWESTASQPYLLEVRSFPCGPVKCLV